MWWPTRYTTPIESNHKYVVAEIPLVYIHTSHRYKIVYKQIMYKLSTVVCAVIIKVKHTDYTGMTVYNALRISLLLLLKIINMWWVAETLGFSKVYHKTPQNDLLFIKHDFYTTVDSYRNCFQTNKKCVRTSWTFPSRF